MLYCDRTANERSQFLSVRIPLRLLRDPTQMDRMLLELYRGGYTETKPSIAAEVLGLPELTWVSKATALLKERVVIS